MRYTAENAITLEVFTREQLIQHKECKVLRKVWRKNSRLHRPHCIGCVEQSVFVAFLIIKPYRTGAERWTVVGICERCRHGQGDAMRREAFARFPKAMIITDRKSEDYPV